MVYSQSCQEQDTSIQTVGDEPSALVTWLTPAGKMMSYSNIPYNYRTYYHIGKYILLINVQQFIEKDCVQFKIMLDVDGVILATFWTAHRPHTFTVRRVIPHTQRIHDEHEM